MHSMPHRHPLTIDTASVGRFFVFIGVLCLFQVRLAFGQNLL